MRRGSVGVVSIQESTKPNKVRHSLHICPTGGATDYCRQLTTVVNERLIQNSDNPSNDVITTQ